MVSQLAWLGMGTVGVVSAALTIRGVFRARWTPEMGLIGGLASMLAWGWFGLEAHAGIAQTSECCTTFEYYPGVGKAAIAVSIASLYLVVKAAFAMLEEE